MTRVAVSGAAGRMGRLVADTVAAQDQLELVGVHDPAGVGQTVAGLEVTGEPGLLAGAEVVVEFTNPAVVMDNLASWRGLGLNAVVGASGFDAERIEAARAVWGGGPPNCLIVPNFSLSAVVLKELARIAAPYFPAVEIVEIHHDRKVDAPSGFAMSVAEEIAAAGGRQERAVESIESAPGARGGAVSGVPVHALRLPGYVSHHEVTYGGPGEALTITQSNIDRSSFMPGVLLAIDAVAGLSDPLTVGLEAILDL